MNEARPATSYFELEQALDISNQRIAELQNALDLRTEENTSLDKMVETLKLETLRLNHDFNESTDEYLKEIEALKKRHEQRDIEDAKDSENFRLLNDSIREDRDRLQKEVDNAQTFLNTAKNYLNNTLYQSVTVLNAGTHRAKDEAMHKLQQMLVIGIGELAKDLKADEFDFF
jgi:hypothetical protein